MKGRSALQSASMKNRSVLPKKGRSGLLRKVEVQQYQRQKYTSRKGESALYINEEHKCIS